MAGPKSDFDHRVEQELEDLLGRFKPRKGEAAVVIVRMLVNEQYVSRATVKSILTAFGGV